MGRALLQCAIVTTISACLVLASCAPAPVEVTELPLTPTEEIGTPVQEDHDAGGLQPETIGGGESTPEEIFSGGYYSLPSSPDIPAADIIQQVAWSAIGGDVECSANCMTDDDENTIYLSSFKPDQSIQIIVYEHTGEGEYYSIGSFLTELPARTDRKGNLQLTLDRRVGDLQFLVLDQNGKIIGRLPFNLQMLDNMKKLATTCPGAPPQRLSVDKMARVCTARETVKLREGPGKNYAILKNLVPGADVKIIDGPKCSDDWSWWKVETESGFIGWMSEGGDSSDPYYLCPAP